MKTTARTDNNVERMRQFILSAGGHSIEHMAVAIRRTGNARTETEMRGIVKDFRRIISVFFEDFDINFPKDSDDTYNKG